MDTKNFSVKPLNMAEPQPDFFLALADDPPLRDNRDVMEYPFLALQKHRTKPIEFQNKNVFLSIGADARFGIATIWDWDVIIGLSAQINDAIEQKLPAVERVQFIPYDLLRAIGRGTGGLDYKKLAAAIRRLWATGIITNIRDEDQPTMGGQGGFRWISGFWIPQRYSASMMTPITPQGDPDPGRPWEVTLCPWLYNAITRRDGILAVHPDYFQLTGGIERWLYRLARKAVPDHADVPAIMFRMDTLHQRSGVTRELKKFAHDVRQIAEAQPLPEYGLTVKKVDSHEVVSLWRDPAKPRRPRHGVTRRLELLE